MDYDRGFERGEVIDNERFLQRLMYRMMQIMALEHPRRLGEMIGAIFTHSPEFFDPDAASNAGPHFVHPYTEFTDEMREELRMSDEDYERISADVRQSLHEDW
jgi:hypothetical protein